jgi:biotin carboxyl carrier protein
MKKLNVTVNGTVYEVTLESATAGAASVASAPEAAPASPSGAGETVNSPLAGTVISIEVSAGASVSVGQRLFTMEAMKMNTYVTAEKAGKVAAILVKEGDQVSEGQAMLELA